MTRQFLSFAVIGAIGFLVDAFTLYAAMHLLGAGLYSGRVLSYLAAATTTWALNRRYTFRPQRSPNMVAEWGRFLGANAAGGLINYLTYAALVATQTTVAEHPALGVAVGSLAGLALNFVLSRYLVFKGHEPVA